MPSSNGSMPVQPQRARKSVRTPILKLPLTSCKRAHESISDDNNSPQPGHEEVGKPSEAETLENSLQPSRRSASSEPTSPMMSPGLRALETSINNTSPRRYSVAYDCFNAQPHVRGHFYSANQLFARGVWIGYLAPGRQSQSFRGLPSFHDLKVNHANFSPPYPPIVQGTARESRYAVCRGCAREESAVITFSEVQFGKRIKVVIMPLDGDDDAGVFAIMVPQTSDRSLHGLQAYRPYEIGNGGLGETFVNNFMMLTLRNPDSEAGTLETVLTVLPPQERADIAVKLKESLERKTRLSSTPKPPKCTGDETTPLAPQNMTKVDDESDTHTNQPTTRKRRKVSENHTQKCEVAGIVPKEVSIVSKEVSIVPKEVSIVPKKVSACPAEPESSIHTRRISEAPADDVKQHTSTPAPTPAPTSTVPSRPPPQITKPANSSTIIPLELTDEQAERVHFIWPVNDEDMEIEFVHTLGECKSFGGLLGLLEEETEDLPSVASILERTKTWKLTYHLGDGANKAIVARKGTKVAFDRLQATLAQASIWSDNPHAKIDIHLKSLNRPDPGGAT